MYDAIVIGARCGGSATAMQLGRKGYRVLLVDKASFPSDTLSTHYIHQPGVARLMRWGLLEEVAATGCPAIERQIFDVGPFALTGTPPPSGGATAGYAPRRSVLDQILVDAAVQAGVELRERFSVKDLIRDGDRIVGIEGRSEGGATVHETAGIVIGADGMRSVVARIVDAPSYDVAPATSCAYYSYFSGVPVDAVELYPRPGAMLIIAPTNDNLTIAIAYWPQSEFDAVRADVENRFTQTFDRVPSLGERLRAGDRAEKIRGTGDLHGFFRKPHGPGWALVGDAGFHKSPILAQGITDAFRDAELLADAIDDGNSGRMPIDQALARYEDARNESARPLYEMTCDLARLEPPDEGMQMLLGALRDDEEQSGRFLGVVAGTVPIREFFAPENVGAIMSRASA